jgi:5-methylcytosine-specific restriction endonuclease McrA
MDREKIINELMVMHRWSRDQIEISELDGHRCRYCDKDLLGNVDDFREWSIDHLVPISRGGDAKDRGNLVLACWTCNIIKRQWDPRTVTAAGDREAFIEATRKFLAAKRENLRQRLDEQRELLLGLA